MVTRMRGKARAAELHHVAAACLGYLMAFYTGDLRNSAKDLWLNGILPLPGGLILVAAFVRSAVDPWTSPDVATKLLGVSGAFAPGIGSLLLDVVLMLAWNALRPAFFRGRTLRRR